ncbi:MAG: RNA polymerase sigma factor RpoD/SigA [bacterium]
MAYLVSKVRDRRVLEDYLRDISSIPLITAEEERNLAMKIKEGDQRAAQKLVEANLRYVISVAKNYSGYGLPLEDLINEGNMGLMEAAKRFDGTRGIKFISYAVWWIRQAILAAIASQSRIVKIPMNRQNMLRKIGRVQSTYLQEYGRPPNTSEIASELGVDDGDIVKTLAGTSTHLSLDKPIKYGEEYNLLDVLGDERQPHPDERTYLGFLPIDIEKALSTLTCREAEVIRLYFGLSGRKPLTLSEIGERFGVTRERARQIKVKAIRKLKHRSRRRFLNIYAT